MDDKYFSTEHEPALGAGPFDPDPAEARAAFRWFVTAMVLHGAYNAAALFLVNPS